MIAKSTSLLMGDRARLVLVLALAAAFVLLKDEQQAMATLLGLRALPMPHPALSGGCTALPLPC